ncbi:MAG: response regulator [bacterium]
MNILLIDDDVFVLSMLQGAFKKWGHKVDSYINPEICPAYCSQTCPCMIFKNGCPDVILTDIHMPLVNGFKFIKELKRKGCKCQKIGMMSGDWSDSDLLKTIRMGVKIFAKPFDLSKIKLWLSGNIQPDVAFMGDGSKEFPISWLAKSNVSYQVMTRSDLQQAWANASDEVESNQQSLQATHRDEFLQYADPNYAGETNPFYRVNVVP